MKKLSIVIPTRNGAKYLNYCLKTCQEIGYQNLEVIISDNNSSDNTYEVASGFLTDPRFKYYNTGADISMRKNFEFALEKVTGDYVLFIGDDDGVFPLGIKKLIKIINSSSPDGITWEYINYVWPAEHLDSLGSIRFSTDYFTGAVESKHSQKILENFCAGHDTKYTNGLNLYHGCVKASLISSIKEKTVEYFQAQIPDVYSSFANLASSKEFIFLRYPVTIAGKSIKSTGSAVFKEKVSACQEKIEKSFLSLINEDSVIPEIDMRIKSIEAIAYACLNRMNLAIRHNSLPIDHGNWRKAIFQKLRPMAEPKRTEYLAIMSDFFKTCDPDYKNLDQHQQISSRPSFFSKVKNKLLAAKLKVVSLNITSPNISTICDVVKFFERIEKQKSKWRFSNASMIGILAKNIRLEKA